MAKISSCFLLLAALVKNLSFAMPLSGFEILPQKSAADADFCGVFSIKNISYYETKNKYGSVKMPLDISANKRKYSNIRIISKSLFNELVFNFKNQNEFKNKKSCFPDIKVDSKRKLKSSFRIANVDIKFDEDIIVTIY